MTCTSTPRRVLVDRITGRYAYVRELDRWYLRTPDGTWVPDVLGRIYDQAGAVLDELTSQAVDTGRRPPATAPTALVNTLRTNPRLAVATPDELEPVGAEERT